MQSNLRYFKNLIKVSAFSKTLAVRPVFNHLTNYRIKRNEDMQGSAD